MFTGIVEACGEVVDRSSRGSGCRLVIELAGLDLSRCQVGDSVAIDGACLTATHVEGSRVAADVSDETLDRTTLGELRPGAWVNVERAVTPSTPLGGHLVTGHVDGVGEVVAREPAGHSERWRFRVPAGLERYIAVKGSIAVAGVSLTVNGVDGCGLEVSLIPHTLAATSLGRRYAGDRVNIEVDLLARYVERLLSAGTSGDSGLTLEQLQQAGFGGR